MRFVAASLCVWLGTLSIAQADSLGCNTAGDASRFFLLAFLLVLWQRGRRLR